MSLTKNEEKRKEKKKKKINQILFPLLVYWVHLLRHVIRVFTRDLLLHSSEAVSIINAIVYYLFTLRCTLLRAKHLALISS